MAAAGCAKVLTCPYHAWSYARDGRLVGVPHRSEYPGLEPDTLGLVPVAVEEWRGFLFVTLEPGAPSVAEMMAPYEAEVAPYRFEELRAIGRVTLRPRALNWKTIADNYSDGLHIPVGHPGLTRLFGRSYTIEAEGHVDRMEGELRRRRCRTMRRERAYQQFLPEAEHLPAVAPQEMALLQAVPQRRVRHLSRPGRLHAVPAGVSATETVIREVSYALPDARREMKAARYLNWRINRRVNAEDSELIARVQAGDGEPVLCRGAAGDERSVPAQLRAEIAAAYSRGAAGAGAASGLVARELKRRDSQRIGRPASARPRPHRVASSPAPKNIAMRIEQGR